MKLVVYIGIFLLLVSLTLFLYTWYRLHIKLNLHAQSSKTNLPTGWVAESKYITNTDGQKIAYWYFPVKSPKAVVILVHGYDNPGGKSQMLIHTKYLSDAGYSTALLDLRSYGESDGNKMTLGVNEWKDVEAVYDKLRAFPENQDKKIGYLGLSMGAATAIMTSGETGKGDFVIASVPYANFNSMFHSQIKAAGLPPVIFYPFMKIAAFLEFEKNYEQFTPSEVIKKIDVPILLISAKQDEELNSQDAIDLYGMANEPKELWETDSGHDVFDTRPEEFKQKILRFLQNQ